MNPIRLTLKNNGYPVIINADLIFDISMDVSGSGSFIDNGNDIGLHVKESLDEIMAIMGFDDRVNVHNNSAPNITDLNTETIKKMLMWYDFFRQCNII
ncbi:MAG: hypothetical protein GY718_09975 [Lentisphaerae bacterium]|nr:hypothetical protein [Lentisphaerota bacterium]